MLLGVKFKLLHEKFQFKTLKSFREKFKNNQNVLLPVGVKMLAQLRPDPVSDFGENCFEKFKNDLYMKVWLAYQ